MKIKKLIMFSLLFLLCFCSLIPKDYVFCDTREYSNVYDDLKQDTNFSLSNYQVDNSDYSLKLIDIAESNQQELFVYVYQACSPNNDLRATSINISTLKDINYNNYSLEFINSYSTLYKYKVQNFDVSISNERIYNISSIFRNWNQQYDIASGNDNTINEVAFAVGKQYEFTGTTKTCKDIELINIESKYVGFVRYLNKIMTGFLDVVSYDSHFVAFSTDKQIDQLLSAEVYFKTQKVKDTSTLFIFNNSYYDDAIDNKVTVNYEDQVVVNYNCALERFVFDSANFGRIQTTSEFISGETRSDIYSGIIFNTHSEHKLTDEALSSLSQTEWVLRFCETEYLLDGDILSYSKSSTLVSNVSILRLEFETNGAYYNLGVVDNKQTGSLEPVNVWTTTYELTDLGKIIALLMLLILLLVLMPLIKVVVKAITLPFKAIKTIKKKTRSKK